MAHEYFIVVLFTKPLMNLYESAMKRRSEARSNAGRCHRAIANLVGGSGRQRRVLLPGEQSLRPRSAAGATPRARYGREDLYVCIGPFALDIE